MRSFAALVLVAAVCIIPQTSQSAPDNETFYGKSNPAGDPELRLHRRDAGAVQFLHGDLANKAAGRGHVQTLVDFISSRPGYFRLTETEARAGLKLNRIDTDRTGMVHVRLDQQYKGIPVVGGELVGHFSAEGRLRTVNGYTFPGISLDPAPVVPADQAAALARDDLAESFGQARPGTAEMVILPRDENYHLCWRLFLFSSAPPGRWEYFVDAHSAEIVFKANRIKELPAIGSGVGVMGQSRDYIDTEQDGYIYMLADYTRRADNNVHGHDGQMPDSGYIRTNSATTTLPGSVALDGNNEWIADSQGPLVDAHVYTCLVYDYWLHHLGRNGYDGNGASMLSIVGYSGSGYNNAYWDGSRVVIWESSGDYRSLAGCPDVLAHEWAHALTEHCSNLAYQGESGALDESFSDMMAAAFEFAHDSLDPADWLAGENAHPDNAGFRDMSDPHVFQDPDYYGPSDPYWVDTEGCEPSSANDWCGVHTNSGVGNKWFYLLSEGGLHNGVNVTGIGVQNAIKIAYRANRYYWTSHTDYPNAALATITAAQDLDNTDIWTLRTAAAWNAVGISTPGPSLVFDYPDSLPFLLTPFAPDSFRINVRGTLGGTPVPGSARLHYRVDDGVWTTANPVQTTPNHYLAIIPAQSCDSEVEYYVSAQRLSGQTVYDPDPATPHRAFPVTEVDTVFSDQGESADGWAVTGDAVDGQWEQGTPEGGGDRGDPAADFDGSGACWLTGNRDGNSDVDNGTTSLLSPVIDASGSDAVVRYARWFSNSTGDSPHEDTMFVHVSSDSGATWVEVETVGPVDQADGDWFTHSFWLSEFVEPSATVRLRFDVADIGGPSIVEAGVDAVRIEHYSCGIPPVTIVTDSVPDWTVGYAYSQQLIAGGGVGTLVWQEQGKGLSGSGLSLTLGGLLSGTPTVTGTISFTAAVTDSLQQAATREFTLQVNPTVSITTDSLPDWTLGASFDRIVEVGGGTGPFVFEDVGGHLAPVGLALDDEGRIHGVPGDTGNVVCTLSVTDAVGDADRKTYEFRINPAIGITTDSLPAWTIGFEYEQTIQAAGGTGALIFSDATSGLIGNGLVLSTEGVLSGVPVTPGDFELHVAVTDQGGDSTGRVFSLELNDTVSIPDQLLPYLHAGQEYLCTLAVNGGTPPLAFSELDSSLAGAGLTLSPGGVLSGIPIDSTAIEFNVSVSDAVGSTSEHLFTIEPAPAFICGDANGSGQVADVADLVYLVDYMFNSGPAPVVMVAADVNASGGIPDVSDLIYMVQYMFFGGPALTCPDLPAAAAPEPTRSADYR